MYILPHRAVGSILNRGHRMSFDEILENKFYSIRFVVLKSFLLARKCCLKSETYKNCNATLKSLRSFYPHYEIPSRYHQPCWEYWTLLITHSGIVLCLDLFSVCSYGNPFFTFPFSSILYSVKWIRKRTKIVMKLGKVFGPILPVMKYPPTTTGPVGNIELFWSHTRASSLGLIFLLFVPLEVPFFLSLLVQFFILSNEFRNVQKL